MRKRLDELRVAQAGTTPVASARWHAANGRSPTGSPSTNRLPISPSLQGEQRGLERHSPYGEEYFEPARSETLTTAEQIGAELRRLVEAGCDDVLLFPCAGDLDQASRLAEATARTNA
jgi:hypothetical protein